jgi:hypothetical protein
MTNVGNEQLIIAAISPYVFLAKEKHAISEEGWYKKRD